MTKEELKERYKEIEAKRIADDVVIVDLWRDKERSCYHHINIVFANNKLFYTGDFGTYVFGSVSHIFEFFKGDKIKPWYWREKCEASDYPPIDPCVECEKARKAVEDFLRENPLDDEQELTTEEIQEKIDECFWDWYENEVVAHLKIENLLIELGYSDTAESASDIVCECQEYSYHYLYACEVIQWVENNLAEWLGESESGK